MSVSKYNSVQKRVRIEQKNVGFEMFLFLLDVYLFAHIYIRMGDNSCIRRACKWDFTVVVFFMIAEMHALISLSNFAEFPYTHNDNCTFQNTIFVINTYRFLYHLMSHLYVSKE